MCNGTIPAFVPNPRNNRMKTRFLVVPGIVRHAVFSASKSNVPACLYINRKATVMNAVPICAITIYIIPALTALSSSLSNTTRKYEVNDIISQANKKSRALPVVTTKSMDAVNSVSNTQFNVILLAEYESLR